MTPTDSLTQWTGWDPRPAAGEAVAEEFARGSRDDQPAGARYELLAVAARGFRPPRFLASVEVPGTGSARMPGAGAGAAQAGLRPTWSLLYRRIAETAPFSVDPYAIYLLGVDPPEGVGDEELAIFNDFYTDVHLVEVAQRRHALRAVRYELERSLRPPYRGAPRYLAVYEVDEESAAHRRHVGPPYARGPEVWQRHSTPWRLWYRRLVPAEGAPPGG